MNHDLDAGIVRAYLVHVLGQKTLMHRTVPLPQNHFGFAQPLGGLSTLQHVGGPHHHFVERNAARVTAVAAQVLIGQKENLSVAAERPLERALGIGGGADHASPLAAERLDGGGGVHVGDGSDAAAFVVGQAEVDELLPGVFHLRNLGHVGHGAAGIQVGEYDRLSGTRQNVGAFRHEVHAAEDDVDRK